MTSDDYYLLFDTGYYILYMYCWSVNVGLLILYRSLELSL